MRNHPIIIVGFMGSGKTSVAHELANQLGVPNVDLDEFIKHFDGRTAERIISEDGEQRFRDIEAAAFQQVLTSRERQVIATGGGAWTNEANRNLISEHDGVSVWLNAPFQLCWKRIDEAAYVRPMAPTREAAEELYETRKPLYELANIHVNVEENDTPQQIAQKITAVLKENSNS